MQKLSSHTLKALFHHYNTEEIRIHYALAQNPPHGTHTLSQKAQFYEYALLDGCCIVPASCTCCKHAGSSLIKVTWTGKTYCGVVDNIFQHVQQRILEEILWAEIQWMKYHDQTPVDGDPWSELYVLLVFHFEIYVDCFAALNSR
jgi:hypothetical protein